MLLKFLLLPDIFSFLKNPYNNLTSNKLSYKEIFQYFLRLGLLSFFIFISFFIVAIIEKLILNSYGIEIKSKDIDLDGWYAILIIVLLGPFLEELIFRLPLSLREREINTSFFILLGNAGAYIVLLCKDMNIDKIERSLINFVFFSIGGGIIYLFNSLTDDSLKNFKNSFGKYIVWGSIVIFALSHLSNIANFDIRLLPIYILNLFPIFCLGTIISFCRLRFGFFYGFLFHAMWNFLPSLFHV